MAFTSSMQIRPEEAKNYKCCQMNKMCEGNKCMAWSHGYTANEKDELIMTPTGYCGLTNKPIDS